MTRPHLAMLFCLLLIPSSGCDVPPTEVDAGAGDAGARDARTMDVGLSEHDADAIATDAHLEPEPGDWRLPTGHFVPTKMPMTVVHPRMDSSPWAFSRNAHPGVPWEIPIVIQGGAWPFRYSVVEAGGADELVVGGELERRAEDGFIVHRVTRDYGVLSWSNPREGTYDILVRVEDQDGSTIDVPITLTVGTAGWLFVDPLRGDDANDGSRTAPFRTIERIHAGGAALAHHRVYLHGVVPMDGNQETGNLRIEPDLAPQAWVGFPGSDAALEAYEGKLAIAAPDFYLANLEHRHRTDYAPDNASFLHMMTVWENTDRFTVHDVTFSRFQGVGRNVDLGNSSVMMFTAQGGPRRYVAVVNCTQTGPAGILTSTYDLDHAVFEKNRGVNANFAVSDGSAWTLIYIKGGTNEFLTLRANVYWDSNTWNVGSGVIGLLQARNIEVGYNVLATPHTTGRRGALLLWTNSAQASFSWTAETPVWIYRNSIRARIHWEGEALANMPDETVVMERNVLDTGTWPTSRRIRSTDNRAGETFFDESMQLVGEARSTNLGRFGAEIAVPE